MFLGCLAHGVLLLTFVRSLRVVAAHRKCPQPTFTRPKSPQNHYATVYPLMGVLELAPWLLSIALP